MVLLVIAGAHGVGKTTTLLPTMLAAGLHVASDPIAPQHWRHVVYIVEEREQAERIVSGLVRHGGLGLDWGKLCASVCTLSKPAACRPTT